jgi:hypothetical protein
MDAFTQTYFKISVKEFQKLCPEIENNLSVQENVLAHINAQLSIIVRRYNKHLNKKGLLICNFCNKPSEHTKHKKCAKCHSSYYCSVKCQINDWRQHKLKCIEFIKPAKKKIGDFLFEVFQNGGENGEQCCIICGKTTDNANNIPYIKCNICYMVHYCSSMCKIRDNRDYSKKCAHMMTFIQEGDRVIKKCVNNFFKSI